ncbi:cation-translocating P-type ATPase [Halomonas alkalicola]|uniref:cation-translocating P-type ATPase n=1 Tax=Halomonas alkalicola TaxID=1930622 RepID=UPI00265DF136|nr:cation-transporting P-type ATPase [Halomonas alkalicola]
MRRSVPEGCLDGLTDPMLGLTAVEAEARLARYGANAIIPGVRGGWRATLTDTLRDPMLWFLIATGLLFAAVGRHGEALVMLLALVPLLGMDAYLHRRTQASVEGLSGRLATTVSVVRDGVAQTVAAEALVPGDLALVRAGESFPADGLLVAGDEMQVDESTLTGESWPVRKQVLEALPPATSRAGVESPHWGLAGTRLLTGQAWLRVALTGAETLYGEVVRSAVAGTHARTPLQQSVAQLVRVLVVVALIFCLVLAGLRYQQGHGLLDALISALTLAIAALPEEFPVVLTFFLGVGVYRLARRRALVRRAVVVENIGRVTCICSDKTGTLTEGRLILSHLHPAPGLSDAHLRQLAAAASQEDSGDPLDEAVLAGHGLQGERRVVARFPFTEARRKASVVMEGEGGLRVAVKGAPEVVFGLCSLVEAERQAWHDDVEAFSAGGHKVIACAYRELSPDGWQGEEPSDGFRMAGLLAFEDPVREGVSDAVAACRAAGIRVIMVTGDHAGTALAIAREAGIGGAEPRVITGDDLAARLEHDGRLPEGIDVVARTLPAQKLALVRALQAQGEIVAVTGDGVNDVPALQAADIGIAMGERGTRVAREVSSIVLLDDNFGSIAGAIAEGRRLFTNLQLCFLYLLMVHIPLVMTAALIPMLGYPLLYLPIHIVWLELIIHPTALLVFQNLPASAALGQPPSRSDRPRFFTPRLWGALLVVGTAATAGVTGLYLYSLGADYAVEHARSVALMALILTGAGITAVLSRLRSTSAWTMVVAAPLLSAVMIHLPGLGSLLGLQPPHVEDWLMVLGGSGIITLLAWVGQRRRPSRA